jgi:DNA-binding SARP family transcriptional activator
LARVYLTGGLRLDGPDGSFTDVDLPGNQGRLTFAALLVHRRALERDALAEIVWDGALPPKWDGALSTIVSKIRSLLGRVGLDPKAIMPTIGGAYAIVLPHDAWVDVEDAARRLDLAEGAVRHGDVFAATAQGTAASAVLRRPFLPGVDGEWVETRRRLHADARYRCAVVLARAWIERGDPGLAVTIIDDAISLDPIREVGHQLLIEAELARGDRGAAQRAYERCRDVLDRELGVGPSPTTRSLVS